MAKTILLALLLCSVVITPSLAAQQAATQPERAPTPPKPAEPEKPTMDSPAAPVDPKSYIIGPEDILLVRVWREPELSGLMVVRPDGKFSLPLIGDVQAGGKTPEAVTQAVTEGLSKFINRPEVLVSVQAVRSKKYLVSGEVMLPGEYPLVLPTTVMEAIVKAGGFREFANRKKILIMRGSRRIYFNYEEVLKGKKLEQNILLENGDHIVVR